MKCPICEKGRLDDMDYELVCMNCGATFLLEYAGMCEEGASERIDDGFEPKEYLEKYGKKINEWKGLS